jgi:hypothetical protein
MYDIHLLQLGFYPVAVVGKLVQKWDRDSYIQKQKQYRKQHKSTEYTNRKHTKQENKHKKNITVEELETNMSYLTATRFTRI